MRRLFEIPLARVLLAAAVAAAALAACTNNDTAIFYFVENEQPVIDYSLDNNSTILGMGSAGGFYFVSLGGSMWQRPTTGTTWTKVRLPSGTDSCTALVRVRWERCMPPRFRAAWASCGPGRPRPSRSGPR